MVHKRKLRHSYEHTGKTFNIVVCGQECTFRFGAILKPKLGCGEVTVRVGDHAACVGLMP